MRVLIAGVPELLRDILSSRLDEDPEIDVRVAQGPAELLTDIGRFQPHVLVATASDVFESYEARRLHAYFLSPDGRSARVVAMHCHGEPMRDVALDQLLASIAAQKES